MRHPFEVLRPEYERLLATVQVERTVEALNAARRILVHKAKYMALVDLGVPPVVIQGLHNRESNADFNTYLGNGQRLDRVTTIVPKGRGPWLPPDAWVKGARDAILYDKLNDNSAPWTMAYACWKGEAWNGFGPRNKGIHTGYLWAGTNHYKRGKYIVDGIWDAHHVDRQLGMIPVMMAIARLDPALAIDVPRQVEAPPLVPDLPEPTPIGVGAGSDRTKWIQSALNGLGHRPLLMVDGSYGRRTREAVREWQAKHGLKADGLAGPITIAVLETALEKL